MLFSFEKLYIYQRSVDFLERMDRVLSELPAEGVGALVTEIRSACLGIPTWIANGNSRRDKEERKACYRRSRAAAFACVPCVEILTRRGIFPPVVSDAVRDELFCITKMISALIHSQDRPHPLDEGLPDGEEPANGNGGRGRLSATSEAAGPT